MKNLKKIIIGMLTLVMALGMLTGCGPDPVETDFSKFLNENMTDVNANYTKITKECGKWESLENDEQLISSINDTLLPTVNDSLKKLEEIKPETDEVKALKDKYVKVINAYKDGFESMQKAAKAGDEAGVTAATDKIQKGVELLDDYNKSLESLAKQFDMEVQY